MIRFYTSNILPQASHPAIASSRAATLQLQTTAWAIEVPSTSVGYRVVLYRFREGLGLPEQIWVLQEKSGLDWSHDPSTLQSTSHL